MRFIEPFSLFPSIHFYNNNWNLSQWQQQKEKNMHLDSIQDEKLIFIERGEKKFTVGTINKNLCRKRMPCETFAKHSRIFYEVLYCTVWHEIKSADGDCWEGRKKAEKSRDTPNWKTESLNLTSSFSDCVW